LLSFQARGQPTGASLPQAGPEKRVVFIRRLMLICGIVIRVLVIRATMIYCIIQAIVIVSIRVVIVIVANLIIFMKLADVFQAMD
jgi:hypothetical protein